MFEKYDINDLYLALISARYPYNSGFKSRNIEDKYMTILKKEGNTYFDLQYIDVKINKKNYPMVVSYTIEHIEPLSKYYNKDGKKKDILTRGQAIKTGGLYIENFCQDHMNIVEKSKVK